MAEREKRRSGADRALSHLDAKGRARMVDVSSKKISERTAMARATINMERGTLDLILSAGIEKGDVLGVARVAGIMAAKKTSELVPMCHPIAITSVNVDFQADKKVSTIDVEVSVKTRDRTGVEMEALTGATVAALTIYDMCKAVDRSMTITSVHLVSKSGGRSGTYIRKGEKN